MARKPAPPPPRPVSPPWDSQRPYLTSSFLTQSPPSSPPAPTTAPNPDAIAVDDALYALLAVRPTHVSVTHRPALAFESPTPAALPPHLAPLFARILPLASHHARVRAFVERNRLAHRGPGFVKQSVAVAIHTLLHEYHDLILRLERPPGHAPWSLQKLLYYLQPTMRTMALLHTLTEHLDLSHGGAALSIVYNLAHSHLGSSHHSILFSHILYHAALPIFHHIEQWLFHGLLADPNHEFFIRQDLRYANPSSVKSWQTRFSIDRDMLPDFLSEFATTILSTGKYLNVLRESNVSITRLHILPSESLSECARHLLATDAPRRIAALVNSAYKSSAAQLLRHLSDTVRLKHRLRTLRRFFLCSEADFLVHFFDIAASELAKPRTIISTTRLASLLDICIRSGVNHADEFADDVTCILTDQHIATEIANIARTSVTTENQTQLQKAQQFGDISGYEAFALDFQLEWPINLVVSETEVLKYQFLFRYLFYMKHVERELEHCWKLHGRAKGALKKVAPSLVRSFALRNRMLHFIRNMLYYTVADVIEPNWRQFAGAMQSAQTIDEIMVHHARFLDRCVTQSLLSNEKHLQVLKALGETCISFATYTEGFNGILRAREDSEFVQKRLNDRSYPNTLAKFETSFDVHLDKLMDGLSAVSKKRANVHLANLCERLDGGGYYSRCKERSIASFGGLQM